MKDLSRISIQFLKKITSIIGSVFLLIIIFVSFEIYIPVNPASKETITFTVQKGWSDDQIASNLKNLGIIRSAYFFKFYSIISLKHSQLQAGEYNLSPRMSAHVIASKMANGSVIRDRIVIFEGWDIKDIGKYLESRDICTQDYFIYLAKGHEGYLFPDTYEISKGATCEDILDLMLANFDKKLTSELRAEINKQKKSIFDIVTMASMIEKEVRSLEDKKIVSGIFWKRISAGMALQSCATVNYVTGKSDPGISLSDMQIDSPYNTYKYRGLPKGPISSPGLDSIMAAIYPTPTKYWYFLSNGSTIFSETFEEHNAAKAKYLGH